MPDEALKAGAAIVGTRRSDLANQINNALVFPGIFRGLLDGRVRKVTTEMKVAAAEAITSVIEPTKEMILPLVTDKRVVEAVARTMAKSS